MNNELLDWTAIIPIRHGSRGLPGKNTRDLCGKPLYMHAVDQALEAGACRVIISTDIPEVLVGKFDSRVEVILRPAELCGDDISTDIVVVHAINKSECLGTVILLQATSPLRKVEDIKQSILIFSEGKYELVMSVVETDRGILKYGTLEAGVFVPISVPSYCFSCRQSLPQVYRPNGAIYVFDARWMLERASFVSDCIGVIKMSEDASLDIDDLADFEKCEQLLSDFVVD